MLRIRRLQNKIRPPHSWRGVQLWGQLGSGCWTGNLGLFSIKRRPLKSETNLSITYWLKDVKRSQTNGEEWLTENHASSGTAATTPTPNPNTNNDDNVSSSNNNDNNDNKQKSTNNKSQTTNSKQHIANNKQQTTNSKQQTTNNNVRLVDLVYLIHCWTIGPTTSARLPPTGAAAFVAWQSAGSANPASPYVMIASEGIPKELNQHIQQKTALKKKEATRPVAPWNLASFLISETSGMWFSQRTPEEKSTNYTISFLGGLYTSLHHLLQWGGQQLFQECTSWFDNYAASWYGTNSTVHMFFLSESSSLSHQKQRWVTHGYYSTSTDGQSNVGNLIASQLDISLFIRHIEGVWDLEAIKITR